MSSGRAGGSGRQGQQQPYCYTQIMKGDLETKLRKWLLAASGSIK